MIERLNFDKDLSYGKQGEGYVLKQIQGKYPQAYIVDGYCKGYDIVVPEVGIKVECKLDRLSIKTGNIAIEYEDRGEPSGISTTEADYWAIIFYGENCWRWGMVDINKLNWMCSQGRKVGGGDGNEARMHLIKTSTFIYLHKTYKC